MSQLLENTYSVFGQFLEGELNQYDLMSLIEEGIISGEVLESMLIESGLVEEYEEELEEGFSNDVKKSINNIKNIPLVKTARRLYYGAKVNSSFNPAYMQTPRPGKENDPFYTKDMAQVDWKHLSNYRKLSYMKRLNKQ